MTSVGIDIVEISRFEELKNLEYFLEKNFSKNEIDYINKKPNKFETMAGIFSCKEAVMKAFKKGIFNFSLTKVEVIRGENNSPEILINDEIKALLQEKNAAEINVSISHSKTHATSICIIN